MTEKEFYLTTPRAFSAAVTGYNERTELEGRAGWEQARLIAKWVANASGRKAPRLLKDKDIITFKWELKESVSKTDYDEGKKRFEELKKKWRKAE